MPIRRRNPRKKVILAGVQGLVIGIVGVLLFGFLLNIANDKKVESKEEVSKPAQTEKEEEKVEVAADPLLVFKAKQYGVFTTKEGAMAFMSTEPTLAKASIVKVGNQFFVWGELFVNNVPSAQTDTRKNISQKNFSIQLLKKKIIQKI